MEMTIEQKIKTLLELHNYIKGDTHFCGYNEENATQSLETAIETIKKYQKIEAIINAPDGCSSAKYHAIFNIVKHADDKDE